MLSFDLINLGADAILMIVLATAFRTYMTKYAALDDKIAKTLSREETKALIEEEIATHLAVIQIEIKSINKTLSQIVEIKVRN